MFDSSKKERKYVECFKSLTNGSCNHCKSRTWNTGNKIYAMKKPDGKWLACTDKKCYQEQGGKITQVVRKKKDTPKNIGLDEFRWPSNEVKTPEPKNKELLIVCKAVAEQEEIILNELEKLNRIIRTVLQ